MCFRYEGPLRQQEVFRQALEGGPASPEFTSLIEWLTTDLASLTGLDDHVCAISGRLSLYLVVLPDKTHTCVNETEQ